MKLTMGQAAKEAEVSKSTLSRWISKGKVSAEKQGDGSYLIDASELDRVKDLQQRSDARNGSGNPTVQRMETPSETSELQHEIDLLRKDLEHSQSLLREKSERITNLERERDEWREQAKKQTLLLTHAQEQQPAPKPNFWQRVFGT